MRSWVSHVDHTREGSHTELLLPQIHTVRLQIKALYGLQKREREQKEDPGERTAKRASLEAFVGAEVHSYLFQSEQ